MWLAILLTLTFGFGLARILVGLQLKEIVDNWKNYRCDPQVMMMAGMFKPNDDPRSSFDFTSDNFNFCSTELAKAALNTALKPVYDVFFQLTHSATQSIGFTMNLRTLASNLFNGLNRLFDIFNRRFNLTLHELHKSFIKQFNAIQKAHAIANASVYAGISLIQGIMNFIKFMVTIVISILVILVVITILFFWLLAPVTPLILASIVTAASFGGAVGGMADSFCFEPSTPIILTNGTTKPICEIKIGDVLLNGSTVTSLMKFAADSHTIMRNLDGIHVSSSHIVYDLDKAVFVKDHYLSKEIICAEKLLYCLNTSDHTIPVKGSSRIWNFADWEELDCENMDDWDSFIHEFLNPGTKYSESDKTILESEAGFSKETLILCKSGLEKQIDEIVIGDIVQDGLGWTKVVGLVTVEGSCAVETGTTFGFTGSCANWIYVENTWKRASSIKEWSEMAPVNTLYSLFTESGTFTINNINIRDFSEIGLHNINSTYDFTLSRL